MRALAILAVLGLMFSALATGYVAVGCSSGGGGGGGDDADDDVDDDTDDDTDDDADDDLPPPTEVLIFQDEMVSKSQKTITTSVTIPEGDWQKIEYSFYADAVSDVWDRIVLSALGEEDAKEIVEFDRGVTDWGYDVKWTRDITGFYALLTGEVTVSTYISTYVENGWEVTSKFLLYPGDEADHPKAIIPILYNEIMQVWPDEGIDTSSLTRTIEFPGSMDALKFQVYATGHSPTGSGSEEFGPARTIRVFIDGEEMGSVVPWRNDCDQTGSHGTKWDRSGWCPRDKVDPLYIEVDNPEDYTGEHEVTVAFDEVTRYFRVSVNAMVW